MLEVLIISGISWFLFYSFQDGNILHGWYAIIEPLGEMLAKPLGMCLVCFTFWIGLLLCLVLNYNPLVVFPSAMVAHFFSPIKEEL